MGRSITWICLLSLLSIQLVNAQQTITKQSDSVSFGTIRVVVPKKFPPHYLLNKNNEPVGFAIDVFNEVAQQAGLDIEYIVKDNWAEVYEAMDDKTADVIPNFGVSSSRLEKYSFTESVEVSEISIAVRSSSTNIISVKDLFGKKVAVVEGNVGVKLMSSYPSVKSKVFKDPNNALFSLLEGDVDSMVYPRDVLTHLVTSVQLAGRIKFLPKPLLEIKRSIAVNKDNIELYNILSESLSIVKQRDKYKELYRKWHSTLDRYWTVDRILIALVSVMFIFVVQLLWHRNSNVKVHEKNLKLLNILDRNVIFSQTDLSGVITDVSQAFVNISGYGYEELVGRSHNIVRHDDMPSSIFKEIWHTIKQEKSIRFEIKNKRKDGSCYWVDTLIEPEYDNKKHIGYISTRFDITSEKEVVDLQDELRKTQQEVIFRMGAIGETRSKETGNHVKRVAEYSKLFALLLGLDKEEAELIKQASPMHDIGKVAIPDAILNKPGKLDSEEWEIMKTHAKIGYDMLSGSSRELLRMAAVISYEHHERYDGTGYPRNLSGDNIHIYGRITAIADVFDALGSDRCYKKAWDDNKIFEHFRNQKGTHFDPKLVDLFFKHLDEFLVIRDKFKDNIE